VKVPEWLWWLQVQLRYKEPEDLPDPSADLDWLFQYKGRVILKGKIDLLPRDNIIKYDPKEVKKEVKTNIQLHECPEEHKTTIQEVIKHLWDVFCQEGMQEQPIR
jgi:hypothetical protein